MTRPSESPPSHPPAGPPRAAELSRRRFLILASATAASLAIGPRRSAAAGLELGAEEPWAGVARLDEGIWAVASTPIESSDWRTGCNGGIVAGTERVLAIESFARPEGAEWVAATARRLAGRAPTDVVVTHYHGDHAGGLTGYAEGDSRPRVWMTAATRDLLRDSGSGDEVRARMLAEAEPIDPDGATELDLGGRAVRLHPRTGHTASDVTVELAEPSIVFGGDLLWNGFFPNYRDTRPTAFAASIRAARRTGPTTYVPGHGALADDAAVGRLLALADAVEEAGRASYEQGVSPSAAAGRFRLPDPVADWVLFNDRYFEVAIGAWHRELESGAASG